MGRGALQRTGQKGENLEIKSPFPVKIFEKEVRLHYRSLFFDIL